MLLIAHRGLTNGPNKELENRPDAITTALDNDYYAEIDLYAFGIDYDAELFLGHDEPQYKINKEFLYRPGLVIHAKNLEALTFLSQRKKYLNYFWHQEDDYTVTSLGWIWAYPGKPVNNSSIAVMPELHYTKEYILKLDCLGICSDYVDTYR